MGAITGARLLRATRPSGCPSTAEAPVPPPPAAPPAAPAACGPLGQHVTAHSQRYHKRSNPFRRCMLVARLTLSLNMLEAKTRVVAVAGAPGAAGLAGVGAALADGGGGWRSAVRPRRLHPRHLDDTTCM